MKQLDHLVYATTNLEKGVLQMEQLLGVRATPGGNHPAWGTHNALIALGGDQFLEIIAPDPDQPPPAGPRIFQLDELEVPRLVTWAAKSDKLAFFISLGLNLGSMLEGSRQRPDGSLLSWRLTDPAVILGDGLVPFLIDWGGTENPARTAAKGCRLIGLRAEHPTPGPIQAMLGLLELDLLVGTGPQPRLWATIDSPNGEVLLC